MILQYYGHSLFTLTFADGTTVATDPYGDFYDYPNRTIEADACTVSHQHHDHNATAMLAGNPRIIDREGDYRLQNGLHITGVLTDHDGQHGELRGRNIVFVYQADGLRTAHLGDLGHVPTDAQLAAIGKVDILLIPVGGNYTIDAAQAVETVRRMQPRVTIPMHYRTRWNEAMPIETEQPFLRLMNASPEPMTVCRITAEDISERAPVLLMQRTDA